MIDPEELLSVAERLIGTDEDNSSSEADLRRAISTSYCAVFHKLTNQIAIEFLGANPSDAKVATVTRWISHTDLRDLFNSLTNPHTAVGAILTPIPDGLNDIATNFISLQDNRESADYGHLFPVTRDLALTWLDTARQTIALADNLFVNGDTVYHQLLKIGIGGMKVAKNRRN